MTKKNTELESGKIKINEDVYATIATMAALETKGIHHMSSTFNDEGAISVTLYVCIQYGYRIPDVVLRLQERINTALVSYTEIEVQTIDVVVQDIIFDDLVTPQLP